MPISGSVLSSPSCSGDVTSDCAGSDLLCTGVSQGCTSPEPRSKNIAQHTTYTKEVSRKRCIQPGAADSPACVTLHYFQFNYNYIFLTVMTSHFLNPPPPHILFTYGTDLSPAILTGTLFKIGVLINYNIESNNEARTLNTTH